MDADDERNPLPVELEEWLEVATRGLCREARERIREEIADHTLEALAEAHEAGVEDDAARSRAVATLGDPGVAARGFRRSNLTPLQAFLLHDARAPHRWRLVVHLSCILIGALIIALLADGAHQVRFGLLALAGMVAASSAAGFLAPRLFRAGRLRNAVMVDALSEWCFFFSIVGGGSFAIDGHLSTARLAFFGAVLGVLLVLYLPLVRKLARPDLST